MYYRGPFIFGGIILLLIVGGIIVFGGGGGKKNPPSASNQLMALPAYATTDAQVSLTTQGIVNGDDLHRNIKITISNNTRELDIIQGYSGHVISTQNFYNTTDAYSTFLTAINNYGFLAKNVKAKVSADESGQCPLGFRYIFTLNQEGSDLSRTWASSCGSAVGTSKGSRTNLQTLFQAQIPNYSQLTSSVSLSATSTPNQ